MFVMAIDDFLWADKLMTRGENLADKCCMWVVYLKRGRRREIGRKVDKREADLGYPTNVG
jgi:hypothetical protein